MPDREETRRRRVSGPPNQGQRQSSRVQSAAARGDSASGSGRTRRGGAAGTGGPTPDAKVRQRVLNRNAESREALSEGRGNAASGGVIGPPTGAPGGGRPLPGSEAFRNLSRPQQIQIERSLGGGPGSGRSNEEITQGEGAPGEQFSQGPKPLGTPAAGAAPPRSDNGITLPPTATPEEQQAIQQNAGVQAGASSGQIQGADNLPPGSPEASDAVRGAAKSEIASGVIPQAPGGLDQSGEFQPDPSMSPQENVETINAQQEAMMAQSQPEPPMPKSPLGNDSPIEQADVQGKLRQGQRHHLRAVGMSQPGMDPSTAREFERKAVRDMDLYGEYDGMDDPHSPPPPIRPGKHSINPHTGQWVVPEGQVSVLDRFGSTGIGGPPTGELSVDNIKGRR